MGLSVNLRNAVPVRGRKQIEQSVMYIWQFQVFEKCSPREGTETLISGFIDIKYFSYLRNAVPVRGRKPISYTLQELLQKIFEKCSPREGTETCRLGTLLLPLDMHLRNAVPVRGRKHGLYDY